MNEWNENRCMGSIGSMMYNTGGETVASETGIVERDIYGKK